MSSTTERWVDPACPACLDCWFGDDPPATKHLAGPAEVVAILGVNRSRLYQLRAREDFPRPLAELAMGPVWSVEEIGRYALTRRYAGASSTEPLEAPE